MNNPITVTLDDRITEILDRLMAKGKDLSPAFRQIATEMRYAVEENFQQEGRPRWEDKMSGKTEEARRRKGQKPPYKLLQDSGRLRDSIQQQSGPMSASVGTDNTIYAAIHQFGGRAGKGHRVAIPARPFLSLADDDVEEIADILGNHLNKTF